MNRDEITAECADRIAMELSDWPGYLNGKNWEERTQEGWISISREQWLQRRTELINCPPDSDAPSEVAKYRTQDANGEWWWHELNPFVVDECAVWDSDGWQSLAAKGAVPNGHDWRNTLTRINHDDNTSTPEEEAEFRRIQARIDSEKPHEADARMLDAQWMSSVALFGCVNTKQACDNITANFKAIRDLNSDPESYLDEQLGRDIATFRKVYKIAEDECEKAYAKPNANSILNAAAQHMQDRAATYDKPEGERSMSATVAAFNAVTGDGVMNTEERGWLFMQLLKAVRSQQGDYRADSYEDGAAYVALAGEAAAKVRGL